MILLNFIKIAFLLSKEQILRNNEEFKLPAKLKLLGFFLQIIFYPIGLFVKPKAPLGQRLTHMLEQLGPIYIKFGQTLSTRPDLVGERVAESLKLLQDRLPPFSTDCAKKIIEQSFGKKLEELFINFQEIPVAAASISQVHKAQTRSGQFVAVKILRPNIHKKYKADINMLYFLAKLLVKFFKQTKRLRPKEVVDVFNQTMHLELDLRLEAAAASEMQDNFSSDHNIYIPKIYWDLTSENILTTQWIDGISIYDTKAILDLGFDPAKISAKIAVMFFNQAYRDGFFHADLHPGNILLRQDGSIALIDFGIMGRLETKDRFAIAEILLGFLKRDYKLIAKIHLKAGYIKEDTNLALFAQSCRAIAEPIIGLAIKDISIGKLLAQLFKVTEDFGMETQPQLLLLQKTMVVVEGIGHSLDPNINMWQLAEPWIERWARKNLSPEAKILRLLKDIVSGLM